MNSYTKKQIIEITELAGHEVQMYIGWPVGDPVVVPEVDPGKGRGKVRRYSAHNLIEFLIIRELTKFGMTIANVKFIMDFLSKYMKDKKLTSNVLKHKNILHVIKIWPDKKSGDIEKVGYGFRVKEEAESALSVKELEERDSVLIINYSRLVKIAFNQ